MSDIRGIFSTAARNNNIVTSIVTTKPVTQSVQFTFSGIPIDTMILTFRESACTTDSFLVKDNARSLIRNHTSFAEYDLFWKFTKLFVQASSNGFSHSFSP